MEDAAWTWPSVICCTAPAFALDGQGSVTVVEIEMVVARAGVVGAGVPAGGAAGAGAPGEAPAGGAGDTGAAVVGPAAGAEEASTGELLDIGVGARVIVDGTLVMIPGLAATWGAQMPAKYDKAACSSPLWLDQELTHS